MHVFHRFKINTVILTMVYADFFYISATGFLSPIFAVFLTSQVRGATLADVGFATTIFWVVKSAVQIPVSWYIDSIPGERDDYRLMVIGYLASCLIPLGYYFFVSEMWHVFLLEALNGIAYALLAPSWLAIFTRHIDKHREGTEWTLYSNAVGLGFAATAAFGGVLAERFGFRVIFLFVSALMFCGGLVLLLIRRQMDGLPTREMIPVGLDEEREKQMR